MSDAHAIPIPEDQALDGRVHAGVLAHIVERGHPPDVGTLAARLDTAEEAVRASLRRLDAGHGLVLHPGDEERVWVAHPFATTPTTFWVTDGRGGWWGNCAWCSLGVAALLDGPVTIATRLGGEDEPIEIRVRDGRVEPSDLFVHFSLPVARAWDNVHFYCATVLAFRSEADVDRWCARHGIPRGEAVPIQTVWELARAWYGGHLSEKWQKWTSSEAAAIFASVGLTGPFWEIPGGAERF